MKRRQLLKWAAGIVAGITASKVVAVKGDVQFSGTLEPVQLDGVRVVTLERTGDSIKYQVSKGGLHEEVMISGCMVPIDPRELGAETEYQVGQAVKRINQRLAA